MSNWTQSLPGNNASMFVNNTNNAAWQVASNVNSNAITIKNKNGDDVMIFHNDGMIETKSGKIKADEWIQIALVMKQFIMDVANDEESAKKYPYVKDMAHGWMMNELRK